MFKSKQHCFLHWDVRCKMQDFKGVNCKIIRFKMKDVKDLKYGQVQAALLLTDM